MNRSLPQLSRYSLDVAAKPLSQAHRIGARRKRIVSRVARTAILLVKVSVAPKPGKRAVFFGTSKRYISLRSILRSLRSILRLHFSAVLRTKRMDVWLEQHGPSLGSTKSPGGLTRL